MGKNNPPYHNNNSKGKGKGKGGNSIRSTTRWEDLTVNPLTKLVIQAPIINEGEGLHRSQPSAR